MNTDNKELEAKFVNINKEELIKKLIEFGAEDKGEDLLTDSSFLDQDLKWREGIKKHVRIRKRNDEITLTFKSRVDNSLHGTTELEVKVSDFDKTRQILEAIGLREVGRREKYRHTFKFKNITIDIDTWPHIPPYVEIEGPNEEEIKEVSDLLGFDWSKAFFGSSGAMINEVYNIPFGKYKVYTFSEIELGEI